MNLLVYLRFLRPLRSLVVVAIYTLLAELWGKSLLGLETVTSSFLALAVALPLLLGFFVAGAALEPMHRPFALVLPNIRRRQRANAAVSVLIAAVVATCGATWWANATVSPVATFGLACALSALPCLDRHQRLGGQAGGLAAFLGWLSTCWVIGPKLALAMNTIPWLFLLGGLGICAASLVQGFSRGSFRARADILFIAYQTNFSSYLFHRGMVARWQAEVMAHRNRQKTSRSAPGRDWVVRSIGASSIDWMRVFWHANFGARKQGSFLNVQLGFAAAILVYTFTLLGIIYFIGQKDIWAILAQLAAPDPKMFTTKTAAGVGVNFMLLLPGMAMVCASLTLRPQLAYPISRLRLARVVFWQAVVQWTAALVVPATTIFLVSLVGQIISGHFLPGYGLPALLAVDLPLAVLLPLLVATGTVRRPTFRLLATVPIAIAIISAGVTRPHLSGYVLSLPGILGMLGSIAASQWLLWHRLHRQYATSDLTLGTGFVNPLALGTITPH